jgi:hypothetical protein
MAGGSALAVQVVRKRGPVGVMLAGPEQVQNPAGASVGLDAGSGEVRLHGQMTQHRQTLLD